MPKVKLLQLFGAYQDISPDSYYTNDVFIPLVNKETEWEDISEEDLMLLQRWVSTKNYSRDVKYIVVVENNCHIVKAISEELVKFKKEQAETEKRRKKNEKVEKARKEKAEKRKLEKARKLLQAAGELKC